MIELSSQVTAKTKENILASAHEIVMPDTGERLDAAIIKNRQDATSASTEFRREINELSANTNTTINALSAQTSIYDDSGVPVSANPVSFQSNGEFVIATVDSEGKLLYGIRTDGSVYQCATDDLTQEQINALRTYVETTIATNIETLSAETNVAINSLSADTATKLQELSDKIDRNWVGVEYVESDGILNAILGNDSKIKSIDVDQDGNITFTQEIN